eukprot:6385871-Prymnesium_polylepis.1
MAFWEDVDDTSSRTPSLHCKMNWYRFFGPSNQSYTTALHHVPKAAKGAAAPDQPARARIRGGAPPTCRQ